MKIMHLTQHFLPYFGGVEMHIYEISRRLVKCGFEVEVVCQKEEGAPEYEEMDGIKISRFSSFNILDLKYGVGRIVPKMLITSVANEADIIHAHAYGFFSTYATMFSNKPTVITAR